MANKLLDEETGAEVRESDQDRLAALTRMVIFAREDALEVGADFPAHCLNVAIAALLDEMRHRGIAFAMGEFAVAGQPNGQNHMN
jgi:hypothetical protein